MFLRSREACAALAPLGLSRGQAHKVLSAGLAGEPVRTRAAVLYEEERVRGLTERPVMHWREAFERFPAGLFVSRRTVDAAQSEPEQIASLGSDWGSVSWWSWFEMGRQIRAHGSLPFVATVAGFVVAGADIVGLRDGSRLLLDPPGVWFGAFDGHRLRNRPGRPWVLHLTPSARAAPGT